MTTRHRALALGLAVATAVALSTPAPAHASTVAAAGDDGVSPWWWMLLLLLPVVVLIVAALRGREEYDFATFTPATGPGFPDLTPQRAARLSALASGRESSAAEAIARADAIAAAAARPVKPGARVPSEGGAVPLPIGASRPYRDDRLRAPDGYPVKAVTASGRYYRLTDDEYPTVQPDLWFATASTAEIAGFESGTAPK